MLTVANLNEEILSTFNIGMNIYEPSWDSPGKILTRTLSKITIEILDIEHVNVWFELTNENSMCSINYSYTDYKNKYFFRTKVDARAKIASNGFEPLD